MFNNSCSVCTLEANQINGRTTALLYCCSNKNFGHLTGSYSNGINTSDYDTYDRNFIIVSYKIVMNEKVKPIDLNKVCSKFKMFTTNTNEFLRFQ